MIRGSSIGHEFLELSVHLDTESVLEKVGRFAAASALRRELALLTHDARHQLLKEALVVHSLEAVGEGLFADVALL